LIKIIYVMNKIQIKIILYVNWLLLSSIKLKSCIIVVFACLQCIYIARFLNI